MIDLSQLKPMTVGDLQRILAQYPPSASVMVNDSHLLETASHELGEYGDVVIDSRFDADALDLDWPEPCLECAAKHEAMYERLGISAENVK